MSDPVTFIGKLLFPFPGMDLQDSTVIIRSIEPYGSDVAEYPEFERSFKIDPSNYIDSAAGVTLATSDIIPVTYELDIPTQKPIRFDVAPSIVPYKLGEIVADGGTIPQSIIMNLIINLKEAVGDVEWGEDGLLTVQYLEPFVADESGEVLFLAARRSYKITDPSQTITDFLVPNKLLPEPNNVKAHMRFTLPDKNNTTFDAYISLDISDPDVYLKDIMRGDYDTP